MSRRADNAGIRGFTLLEVMVALAILATTLVVLLQIITNNVRATNHAKMTTAATLLARSKMTDIEDSILENGFSTDNESDKGTFRDQNFPSFRWESTIERIELPTDLKQAAQDQSSDDSKSKDPMQALTGMMGGLMSGFMDPIRIGLRGVGAARDRQGLLGRGRPARSQLRGGAVPRPIRPSWTRR